jgi:hypothetical protein
LLHLGFDLLRIACEVFQGWHRLRHVPVI